MGSTSFTIAVIWLLFLLVIIITARETSLFNLYITFNFVSDTVHLLSPTLAINIVT